MGEIKSTLDLVMERTKHLRFSEDERREQRDKEFGAKLRGLVQKLHAQTISAVQFARDYRRLKSDYDLGDDSALIAECLGHLRLDGGNQIILDAMQAAIGYERAAVQTVIDRFERRHAALAQNAERRISLELSRRDHICGTAVVPNLNLDEQWHRDAADLDDEFKQKLSELQNSSAR